MRIFRFERLDKPIATHRVFFGRLARNVVLALAMVGAALAIGMVGYRLTEGMDWLDAYLNAAMLLGGMGEVDALHTEAGKVFAGTYALFCGLLIVIASGIILAPSSTASSTRCTRTMTPVRAHSQRLSPLA